MKIFLTLITLILISFITMGQNEHPMRISMVSVFVEDSVKAFKYYTEVLGSEEVMYSNENYIAIVKSPIDRDGNILLLEPTKPGGIEIAKEYKKQLYSMGIPVLSFGAIDIRNTLAELKKNGVIFKKDPIKTDNAIEAIFDDSNRNYIQLFQLN